MPDAKILKLTDADFDTQVKAQPLIAPVLEELAGEYADRLAVGKVNVDENRQIAARFGIRSIPTLLFFRDGARMDQVVGAHPKSAIKAKIDQLLNAH